jgi:hypothetical protein
MVKFTHYLYTPQKEGNLICLVALLVQVLNKFGVVDSIIQKKL